MSRLHLLVCSAAAAAAVAIAAPTFAATSPPGMNLRWDHCYADGGASNRTFTCDSNVGSETLVMSFELASDMPQVSGMEFVIVFASASPALPAWWQFKNIGTCRQGALSYSTSPPPGSVNCSDWSNGAGVGGIAAYNIGYAGPNTAILKGAEAVPATNLADLQAGVEYSIGNVGISHTKTVGTSCGGCSTPVCIVFSELNVTTPVAGNSVRLINGANYQGSAMLSWQNSYIASLGLAGQGTGLYPAVIYQCVPYDVTPTRNSTWGSVKALYR